MVTELPFSLTYRLVRHLEIHALLELGAVQTKNSGDAFVSFSFRSHYLSTRIVQPGVGAHSMPRATRHKVRRPQGWNKRNLWFPKVHDSLLWVFSIIVIVYRCGHRDDRRTKQTNKNGDKNRNKLLPGKHTPLPGT